MSDVQKQRREIERLCEEQFGPDWRDKAIVGPLGVIRLRDLPDEAGPAPPLSQAYGLWQILPTKPPN